MLAVIGLSSLQIRRARLTLGHAGVLTVRHVVRTETVDLSRLTGATAAQRYRSRGTGARRARRLTRVLELRDADGRDVTVEPSRWQHADLLVAAVGAAAAFASIPVEGGELFGLAGPVSAPSPGAEWGRPAGW